MQIGKANEQIGVIHEALDGYGIPEMHNCGEALHGIPLPPLLPSIANSLKDSNNVTSDEDVEESISTKHQQIMNDLMGDFDGHSQEDD